MSRLEEIAKKLDNMALPKIDFEAYFKAQEGDKEKIKLVSEYIDELEDYLNKGDDIDGVQFHFQKTQGKFGFRSGEVTLWTGFNGHKKSMMLGYVCLKSFIPANETVCIASFEMKPVQTISRIVTQFTSVHRPTDADYADFINYVGRRLYILDQMGGMTAKRLYGVIYYAAKELGVKHFVIDSMMRVVPGEDDHNAQKDFIVKLCDIAIETDCHIHVVHHVKKGDEKNPPSRYDAKGSGAISDNVHNHISVWSNKLGIDGMPDVILNIDKQRNGSWEGKVSLAFEPRHLQFHEPQFNV
jgi:twinkle protein